MVAMCIRREDGMGERAILLVSLMLVMISAFLWLAMGSVPAVPVFVIAGVALAMAVGMDVFTVFSTAFVCGYIETSMW